MKSVRMLTLSTQRKMKEGLSETDARRAALVEFGGAEQVKEQVRDVRLGHFLETRLQDLRFAFRTLRKAPVFSLTVALVLALGIGSTALMFTIVNSVLLEGPPYPEADRLSCSGRICRRKIASRFPPGNSRSGTSRRQLFENLSAADMGNGFTLTGRGEPELALRPSGHAVAFPNAARERSLSAASFSRRKAEVGKDRVVILSHAFWRDKFGMRPDVLGQPVVHEWQALHHRRRHAGEVRFPPADVKLWVPAALDGPFYQQHPDAHFLRVIGRLKPGVTPQRLQAEVDLLGKRVDPPDDDTDAALLRDQPEGIHHRRSAQSAARPSLRRRVPASDRLRERRQPDAGARPMRARAEMAIRAAMGASRPQVDRAIAHGSGGARRASAACLGIGIAVVGTRFAEASFGADNIPELAHAHLDGSALGFVLLDLRASPAFSLASGPPSPPRAPIFKPP